MRIAGRLNVGSACTLLRLLGSNRSSGALNLHAPEGDATLWFHDGRVVRASSGTVQPLGRLLVDRGHMDDAQLDSAVLIQQRGTAHRRIGSILAGLSVVEQPRIRAALATSIRSVVGTVAEWSDGSYEFEPSEDEAPDHLFEGLDAEALVEMVESD